MTIPSNLNPGSFLANAYVNSGLYTKQEINTAKYTKYSRFGRVLDPYGRLNDTTEYLFFTKPDLHIVDPNSSSMKLNEELSGNGYFVDLVRLYPDVVRQLQLSAPGNGSDPFAHLLSFCANSSLELPGIEANTMDTPATMFGTSIEYLGDAEASDNKHSFSLEFVDSKELELYHFFKAYQEYQIERKSGIVTPPSRKYTYNRKLHNVMGCYKFLIDEDMETIIYWAYLWGIFPVSAPRESFSDPTFPNGNTFSVSFKAQFVEDMNPIILKEFNQKMEPLISGKSIIPIHQLTTINGQVLGNPTGTVIGQLPSAAYIRELASSTANGIVRRSKYKMRWY